MGISSPETASLTVGVLDAMMTSVEVGEMMLFQTVDSLFQHFLRRTIAVP
jgi:hypothetical protein